MATTIIRAFSVTGPGNEHDGYTVLYSDEGVYWTCHDLADELGITVDGPFYKGEDKDAHGDPTISFEYSFENAEQEREFLLRAGGFKAKR